MSDCYDNETEILTDKGWKLFDNLSGEENVMTLNQVTGDKEWQLPYKRQEFQHDGELYEVVLEDGSEMRVSPEHNVYAGEDKNEKDSISFVVMPKENEDDVFVLFINPEFKNKPLHDMDSPFSSKVVFQRFIMTGVKNNFINLILNNFSQNRILFTGLFDISFTGGNERKTVTHFNEEKNSSAEVYFLPETSFNLLFNSSECSFLIGSSSTGCQSICSQNSQSSSVKSPFCLYLLNISRFKNSINALPSNLDATFVCNSFGNCILNSSILIDNHEVEDYKNLSIANFALQPITEVYSSLLKGKEVYFLNSENKPIKIKSISKVSYSGKIYDVDVENDVVLVKRHNSSMIWSGNSNNYSQDTFDLRIIGSAIEFDYIVDPYQDSGELTQNVNDCGTLNTTNTVYTLTQNVTSNSTCFTILANNITLDGGGYTINYSANGTVGIGVNVTNYNFTTVKNVRIRVGTV